MRKYYVLLITVMVFSATVYAQRKIVSGYLRDSLTYLPIAGGNITNSTIRQTVVSDKNGFFHVAAAPNDLLYASARDYQYDTLRYSLLFTDTITIYLPPSATMLENVTVTAGYQKYHMDSLERRKDFEQLMGQRMQTIERNHTSGFGLVINMDRLFKSKYKHQRRAEQSFNDTEKREYVDYRFSPQLVAFYTGLKGDMLLQFMQRYRPTYEWLRQHPQREQLIDYISDKLKAFRNNK